MGDKDDEMDTFAENSREVFIRRFKKDPSSFSLLIANPQACAESISLHRVCHDAIYVDKSYNCGEFMQSKKLYMSFCQLIQSVILLNL